MTIYDFDLQIQDVFNTLFSNIKPIDWRNWLDIDSKEEYEEITIKNSGLDSVKNLMNRIKYEETNSRSFSIDLEKFLDSYHEQNTPIFCHTSGTTNSNLSMLKWFHMSKDIVKKLWAPGMRAIFESSGLDSKSSAVIFVPSRLKFDGIRTHEDINYISIYSSEFSQRIMLSIIHPKSYLFYEYKKSRNLDILSKILSMEDISVISAPAITILKWADINKLQEGLKNSLAQIEINNDPNTEKLVSKIQKEGINTISKEIQEKLSEKLSKATLIFSISSLSESDWNLIRKFMKWENGNERFTNLYVASEIGPFAASINKGDFKISRKNRMYVFPLTLPVLESRGKKELISRAKNKIGKLYISRLNDSSPLINIDTGDVISVRLDNVEGLPQIDGNILRSSFPLKYPIKISEQIDIKPGYSVYAGDYFSFDDFEIYNPRLILNHLKLNCEFDIDSLLLIKQNDSHNLTWKLIIPKNKNSNCSNQDKIKEIIMNSKLSDTLKIAIKNKKIDLELINGQPIDFLKEREKMLYKVRNGQISKGILKKWPLYVIESL